MDAVKNVYCPNCGQLVALNAGVIRKHKKPKPNQKIPCSYSGVSYEAVKESPVTGEPVKRQTSMGKFAAEHAAKQAEEQANKPSTEEQAELNNGFAQFVDRYEESAKYHPAPKLPITIEPDIFSD